MWQFSIFIGNRLKHKTTDIWRCANEDQCVPDKTGCSCRTINTNNTKRSACKAGLLVLRMSVKLTRVTRVVLPNNLIELISSPYWEKISMRRKTVLLEHTRDTFTPVAESGQFRPLRLGREEGRFDHILENPHCNENLTVHTVVTDGPLN